MTRDEALREGILLATRYLGEIMDLDVDRAAANLIESCYGFNAEQGTPDEIEGFAVGLTMIAVEVAEMARKRREATAATLDAPESKPGGEAFTYDRVEVAGPAGDPIWVYERRPLRT